ncbi:MAG: hypothetical protein H7281_08260 [Bacteriovorax sp.]|nr:hypothetical protein [Bacteriovorax sp.]
MKRKIPLDSRSLFIILISQASLLHHQELARIFEEHNQSEPKKIWPYK